MWCIPWITIRRARAFRQICLFLSLVSVTGVLTGMPSVGAAEQAVRIPAKPWGLETAAGECVVCHSLEQGGPFRYAPNLYGIVGAEKARDRDWYGYSQALMTLGGTWTETDLDAYLANASQFAPGTKKTIRVSDPEQRRQIIEFLKSLH